MQRKDVAKQSKMAKWRRSIVAVTLCGCLLTGCSEGTKSVDDMSPKEMKSEISTLRQERDRQARMILDYERTIRVLKDDLEREKNQSKHDQDEQAATFQVKLMWYCAFFFLLILLSFVFGMILGSRAHKAMKKAKTESIKGDVA